jgi:hypothetical protein
MAEGATCTNNASDTLSTALSRIFNLIKAVILRRYNQDPLYSIDPQTRDRIYNKTNTNFTVWYVNA